MNQQRSTGTGVKNFILSVVSIFIASFFGVTSQPVTHANEMVSSSESITASVAAETQAIYIDANVVSDHKTKETKVSGETVPGAEVTITYPNEEAMIGEADKNGEFIFSRLPALKDGDEIQVKAENGSQTYEIIFNYHGTE